VSELTEFGFRMGAMEVIRMAEVDGYATISVRAGNRRWEITASPKGQIMWITPQDGAHKAVQVRLRDGIEVDLNFYEDREGVHRYVGAYHPTTGYINHIDLDGGEQGPL